jgi:carbon-monoxide dehydrogenase medium subunit
MEIAVVNVAAFLALDEGGHCREARIALGSVAPTAIRAKEAEDLLIGRRLNGLRLAEAGRAAAGECRPISDVRASAEYRLVLVSTLVERALHRGSPKSAEAGSGPASGA